MPLLLKDLLTAYRGLPLTVRTDRYLQDFVAPDDSVIAQSTGRREAASFSLAKTVTPEYGLLRIASEPPIYPPAPTTRGILT